MYCLAKRLQLTRGCHLTSYGSVLYLMHYFKAYMMYQYERTAQQTTLVNWATFRQVDLYPTDLNKSSWVVRLSLSNTIASDGLRAYLCSRYIQTQKCYFKPTRMTLDKRIEIGSTSVSMHFALGTFLKRIGPNASSLRDTAVTSYNLCEYSYQD